MKDTSTRISFRSAYCLTAFMFMLLFSAQIFAQSRVITGTVTDSKGEPLPGVTVKVKGSSTGATTTPEGKFSLRIPGDQAVVTFSYLGFTTQEILVGKKTSLNVALKEDATSLKEVVVNIAYGSAKKTDLTGSVAVVKMEDVLKAPVPTIDQALAGRVAGVQIVSPDGQPGGVADIAIRGTGSITSSSSPLYVVDGFPQEDSPLGTLSNNDIESITVLKDASSTAIYGARGANGVVVITTKRGTTGKAKIAYNGFAGTQNVFKKLDLMDPYDFVRLQNDINSGYARAVYFTNGRTLESYRNIEGIDWQDKVFQTAPFANHTLSISGKNAGTTYFVSGNYVDQKGIIISSGFKRYQGRINLDQEVTKSFKVGIVSNYSSTKSYGNQPTTQSQGLPGTQGTQNNLSFNLMQNIWTYLPVNGSGDLSSLENDFQDDEAGDRDLDRLNPYIIAQNTINDNFVNNLQANSYAELKFLKNFKLRSTAGITYNTNRREFFNNSLSRGGSPLTSQGANNGMNGGINNSNSFSFLNENTLTYDRKIHKDHSINALVGITNQLSRSSASSFSAVQVPNEALGVAGLDEGTPYGQGSSSSKNTLVSLLSRVNYGYKSKYLLTATMRGDASSKFYEGHKWGYFPSGAIAWRLSEEEFVKKIKAISNAKLKLSYGITGNNRVGDFAYASQIALSGSGTGTRTSFNNTIITGAVPTKMFTPDVRWETSATLDAGLELGLLRDRISIETDYYKKKTKDLLLVSNIPSSLGFNTTLENIGDIQNEGFEFSLNTVNIQKKDFTWSSSFNISFNKNKVLKLARNQDVREEFGASTTFSTDFANQPLYIAQVGKPVASFYGYVYNGLYRLADFDVIQNGTTTTYRLKANVPYFNNATTPQPGDIKFRDLNGDGVINSDDYAVIGNPYPKHFGGLSNNFTYKGFDLNVFLQWSYGNEVFNGNRVALEGQSTGDARGLGLNMLASYADYWTLNNDDATQPRALVTAFGQRSFSSRFIEDASFLRLKTVALGYSIPAKLVSKIGLSTAKVFVSGQNLKTWTKYQGPDPEVSTKSSPTTPGFDFSAYPRTRVFVLGANITF